MAVTRSALHSSGYPADDAFWKKLESQGAFLGNSIGLMCTASGKLLGSQDIGKALAAWEGLPLAERKPGAITIEERGPFDARKSVQAPPGGMILRGFMRELEQAPREELRAPRKRGDIQFGPKRYEIRHEPNRDFVWLTEAEWRSLVAGDWKVNETRPLPPSIHDRLVRFHLVDGALGLSGPWDQKHIQRSDLKLTATKVTPGNIELMLSGTVFLGDHADRQKASTYYDARMLGYLTYDEEKRAFTRVDLTVVGEFKRKNAPHPTVLGIAMELASGESACDRVPPRGTRLVSGSSASLEDYFAKAPGVIR